ncbi:MAG: endoglucanase [Gammaproteobacteria bacterium]|nr:endoglucanase [Gammaproteobacteria bacterium]
MSNKLLRIAFLCMFGALSGCGYQQGAFPRLDATSWQIYKHRFVSSDGRVVMRGNDDISTSEGQGYGMLFALAADDRTTFSRIWNWTRTNLAQRKDGLLVWRWQPQPPHLPENRNNASDGDLLVAWALTEAGTLWDDATYLQAAKHIAQAYTRHLVRETPFGPIMLPASEGFVHAHALTVNLSYWVYPALSAMQSVDPDPVWQRLTTSGLALTEWAHFGAWQLPPDWLDISGGQIELSKYMPTHFGYDAVRIPIYACWAGTPPLPSLVHIHAFLASNNAPAWVDLSHRRHASHGLSPGERAVRMLSEKCLEGRKGLREFASKPPALPKDAGYYDASLILLSRLAAKAASMKGATQ